MEKKAGKNLKISEAHIRMKQEEGILEISIAGAGKNTFRRC